MIKRGYDTDNGIICPSMGRAKGGRGGDRKKIGDEERKLKRKRK